ncbi:MAG: HPr family phosphocarrier protein [Ancalomicrobiaceae bacterium]|nr:HPr family phosphocarrier protein [Ancalomicrobiaceae bacterium]
MHTTVTARVTLRHKEGLHARPSVKLTKTAKRFQSRIEFALSDEGPWIDAKSILKVMAARAPRDTILNIRADGPDAEQAADAIVQLIETDFAERDSGPDHSRRDNPGQDQ